MATDLSVFPQLWVAGGIGAAARFIDHRVHRLKNYFGIPVSLKNPVNDNIEIFCGLFQGDFVEQEGIVCGELNEYHIGLMGDNGRSLVLLCIICFIMLSALPARATVGK